MNTPPTRYQAWLEVASTSESLEELTHTLGDPTWDISSDRDHPGPGGTARRGLTQWRLAMCDHVGPGFDPVLRRAIARLEGFVRNAEGKRAAVVIGVFYATACTTLDLDEATTQLIGAFGFGLSVTCYPVSGG